MAELYVMHDVENARVTRTSRAKQPRDAATPTRVKFGDLTNVLASRPSEEAGKSKAKAVELSARKVVPREARVTDERETPAKTFAGRKLLKVRTLTERRGTREEAKVNCVCARTTI
eukprot:1180894-Prorocentrum_minimum.AAC.3